MPCTAGEHHSATREGHHYGHGHRADLWDSCAKYSSDWDGFYGYLIILEHDAVADARVLFTETTP